MQKWTLINEKFVQFFIPCFKEKVINTSKTPNPLAPFKIGTPDLENGSVNLGHIQKIYHQNNYTNEILHIVSN